MQQTHCRTVGVFLGKIAPIPFFSPWRIVPRTLSSSFLEHAYKGPVPLVCTTLFATARGICIWCLSWVLREPAGEPAYLQSADCERNQKSTFFFQQFTNLPTRTLDTFPGYILSHRQGPVSHQKPWDHTPRRPIPPKAAVYRGCVFLGFTYTCTWTFCLSQSADCN